MKYRSTKKNKIPSGGITIKNQILARAFLVFATELVVIKMKFDKVGKDIEGYPINM